ncbi:hypothetical protein A1Q1_02906 [Trichosporon asahii var. asahii CBS 2479]|uniref:Mediator of RNA polymerase II transcription subunit 21 n=1 Tax=Trichosporon asahii var. asahii (strain ATCC 90039 / CBS 2479 / JCM 2466 / KCTC 7840 / NBRC 103889/ NCYC 2677 / UAMH 7654) TaxID=1186058 RepID=J5SXT3_TRIAS|nr:hypothetical protein A1Q1_02906 [Trichosporon asahii var. asahii CBS 2479]EJT48096.1 hypothetical protein A1Q1_02906 [Trichosporon asahii var. asahii CBS 2479]
MLSEELSTDMDNSASLRPHVSESENGRGTEKTRRGTEGGSPSAPQFLGRANIQLQDAILDFEQTSAAIPTTLTTARAARRKEYRTAIETFVADIVRRAKDVETLIAALPSKNDSAGRAEMAQANAEYKDALAEAEALLGELRDTLKVTLGDGTERNVPSLKNAVAAM